MSSKPETVGLEALMDLSKWSGRVDKYIKDQLRIEQAMLKGADAITKSGAKAKAAGGLIAGLGKAALGAVAGVALLAGGAALGLLIGGLKIAVNLAKQASTALLDFGRDALMTAGRVDELERSASLLAQRMGYSADEAQGFLDELADVGIRADVAAQTIAQLSRYNIDLAKATDLATVAQNAAVIVGEDSSENLEGLIHGISTYRSQVLRTHGITVNMNQAQAAYAAEIGKTVDQLNEEEKVQAAFNAVLAQGAGIAGVYTAAMESPTKALRSLGREFYNLKAAIGKPLLEGFAKVVSVLRTVVQRITAMVKEGGVLYPVIVKIGAALSLLGDQLTKMADEALTAIEAFAGELADGANSTIEDALKWGVELMAALAEGIVKGAAWAITAAMDFVTWLLADFLRAKSPPKVAPRIDEWGAATMNEYLKGFTKADFDLLKRLQGPLRTVLDPKQFAAMSGEIARALTRGADAGFFDKLAKAAGRFGGEIAELARREFELADATRAMDEAYGDYVGSQEKVDELTREYNQLLREGADKQTLKAKLAQINAAEEEGEAAKARVETSQDEIDAMKERVELQSELVEQLMLLVRQQEQAAAAGAPGAGLGGGIAGGVLGDFDLSTRLGEAIETAKATLSEKLPDLFKPLEEAWGRIEGILFGAEGEEGGGLLGRIDRFLTEEMPSNVEGLQRFIEDPLGSFADGIKAGLDRSAKGWETFVLEAYLFITRFLVDTVWAVVSVGQQIVAAIAGVWNMAKNWVIVKVSEIALWLRARWRDFVDIGRRLIEGLIRGIESLWDDVVQIAEDIANSIIDALDDIFGSHSPSKEAYKRGAWLAQGLVKGYEDMLAQGGIEAATAPIVETPVSGTGAGTTVHNTTTNAQQAQFGPNFISEPMGWVQFEAMANDWARRNLA